MISRLFPDRTPAHTQPTAEQFTKQREEYQNRINRLHDRIRYLQFEQQIAQERITQLTRNLAQCQNQLAMTQHQHMTDHP